jgi:hypothetical protein
MMMFNVCKGCGSDCESGQKKSDDKDLVASDGNDSTIWLRNLPAHHCGGAEIRLLQLLCVAHKIYEAEVAGRSKRQR